MGHDIGTITTSKESIRKARLAGREAICREIRESFMNNTIFIVHWDTKILSDLTTAKSALYQTDRLAIILSGNGTTKLLGVPKIQNGTGSMQAAAVYNALEDWNVLENVKGMCFDTTSSNTGSRQGACTILEKMLNRSLLYFACRHHVYELIISKVFSVVFKEVFSGPDILLFKRFKNYWPKIKTDSYRSAMEEKKIAELFQPEEKTQIIDFIKNQIEYFKNKTRDDYVEFLYLAALFLGETIKNKSHNNKSIRQPGAVHRARWMAKIIYCLKIFLYRDQFKFKSKILV